MPWTIPNLLLHDKPLPLVEQRAFGYTKLFVYCSNPGCHHNAVLDASHTGSAITGVRTFGRLGRSVDTIVQGTIYPEPCLN